MGTAHWSWVIANTDGSHVSDLVKVTGRALSFAIDDTASAKWTSRGDDLGAVAALEMATDLIVYRDDTPMFRGRVGATSDDLDGTSHQIAWTAIGYRGVIGSRVIWPTSTVTFAATEQATIAWTLIADSQALPGGNLGITNTATATGQLRDRTYDPGKNIGEALNQLAAVTNGFDWDISPELEHQIWYPSRGSSVGWAAVHGDTVAKVRRTVDPSSFASDLFGTGGDGTTPVTESVGSHGDAGRWETTVSWSDVTVQSTLTENAEAALAVMSEIIPSYQLTLTPGRWSPSDAWLGDTVRFVCRSGRLNVDTTGRIVQVDITLGDDGGEQVVVTLDKRRPTLRDRIMKMQDRLATLSRS